MVTKQQLFFGFAAAFSIILALSSVSAAWSDVLHTITGKATSQPVTINITVSNNAPQIVRVFAIPDQSITENSRTLVLINFSATDADGYANLDDTSARINLSRTGETPVRKNSTCLRYQQAGNNANYSCTLDVWYYDSAGEWNISVFLGDVSFANATNMSTNVTLLQTSAFVTGPSAITFGAITPGSTNTTSTNDPLLLNNTGNKAITAGNIQINATHLKGETDNTKALYAGNFTLGTQTGGSPPDECGATGATNMARAVFTAVSGSTLPRGNNSVNDGATGQEQLYFCLRQAGSELTAQAYSTASEGSWTAKVI